MKPVKPMRNMSPSILGLTWLISLGIFFVLGILFSFTLYLKPDHEKADATMDLSDRELKLVFEKLGIPSVDFQEIKSVAKDDSFPSSVEDSLIQAILWKDAEERGYLLRVLANGLPLRKVMASIQFLLSRPASPGANEALQIFLDRWASSDGRSALAFTLSLPYDSRRDLLTRAVLQGWSSVHPEEAWNWVKSQRISRRIQFSYFESIVVGLAVNETEKVFKLIGDLDDSELALGLTLTLLQKQMLVQSIRGLLAELDWIREDISSEVLVFVGESWALEEPALALNWMKDNGLSGEQLKNALDSYAWRDPEAAIEWTLTHLEPASLSTSLERVALTWMDIAGPSPLANWINNQEPSPLLDGAVRQLAITSAQLDKVAGIQWAESIFDEDDRTYVEILIAEEWINSNPDEAYAVLNEILPEGRVRNYFFDTAEVIPVKKSEEIIVKSGQSVEIVVDSGSDQTDGQ